MSAVKPPTGKEGTGTTTPSIQYFPLAVTFPLVISTWRHPLELQYEFFILSFFSLQDCVGMGPK